MVMLRGMRLRRHLRTCEACRGHLFVSRVPRPGGQAVRVGSCPPSTDWARKILVEALKAKGVDVNEYCLFELYPKDQQGPAEYCPEDPEPGSDYCYIHNPDRCEPDWDDRRKELLYDCE